MSKSKKLIFMVVGILILVAAVIGVTKYNEYQASLEPEESSSSMVLKNLIENEKANIKSINLLTQEDSITLIPNGNKETTGEIIWALEGHEDWKLKNTHSSIASMATLFQVYKEIEKDVTDEARLDEFGLKDPSSIMTVTLKDGTVQQVKIGIVSSDGEYAFCQLVGDDTVYACNSTYSGYANFTKQTIRLETISTSIKTDQDLKYMFMQKKGSRPVEIQFDDSWLDNVTSQSDVFLMENYKFIEPYTASHIRVRRDLLETYFPALLTPEVAEMVEADCTDFDKYGVGDEPEYHEIIKTMSTDGKTENVTDYYFGYTYGENNQYMYFREGGSNMVLGIYVDCMEYRSFEPFDFTNKLVYLNTITNIQSGSVTVDGETYEFSVKRQELSEEATAEEALAVYRIDGNLVDTDAFLLAYQNMIAVAPDYEIVGEVPDYDESDKVSMTFVYNNGTEETIEYYRLSEFYYVTAADDDIWFACSDAYIEAIAESMIACVETMEE